jgi:hypothetical protein
MAQRALGATDERTRAMRDVLAELLMMDQPRRHVAGTLSGLGIHYDLGPGRHPMLGWRVPDLDITVANRPLRVFELLHQARPVLLNIGGAALDITPWAHRVDLVAAAYAGTWELPVLGEVSAPASVLIRPDGHIAWVGEGGDEGLRAALTTWLGRP